MDYQASTCSPRLSQQTQTLIFLGAGFAALLSVIFAAYTTPGRSVDLRPLYDTARFWVEGNYNSSLQLNVYPPATPVLLSPIAFLSFKTLIVVWFIINLALTGLSAGLVAKLVGSAWPWRVKYYLWFFVMTWAPFRVTLRNGQITMLIIALLLGSLVAWRRNRPALSGVLFGMALCKYTLSFPFLFYFVWHQQWKLIFTAVGLQAALTGVFAYRLGLSLIDTVTNYIMTATQFSLSFPGSSDLNSLLLGITGGHAMASILVAGTAVIFSLVAIFFILRHRPEAVQSHIALLSLFALWSVYHRTYDFMLCMIPVAALVDYLLKQRLPRFSWFWLTGFATLALGIPGFMAGRVGNWTSSPAGSALVFFMTQSERLLTLGMFCSLMFVLWKRLDQLPDRRSLIGNKSVGSLA